MGIKYDNIAKKLSNQVLGEGLHFGPPGFYFIVFPSVYQTMEFKDITVIKKMHCFFFVLVTSSSERTGGQLGNSVEGG